MKKYERLNSIANHLALSKADFEDIFIAYVEDLKEEKGESYVTDLKVSAVERMAEGITSEVDDDYLF